MLGNGFLVAIAILFSGEIAAEPATPAASIAQSTLMPEVAGIGVALRVKEGKCYVVRVLKDTPAAAEGSLQAKDEIVAVAEGEGTPTTVARMKLGDVSALIRGRVGTEVRLTIAPADNKTQRVVRLVRGSIDELLNFGQEPLPIGSPAPQAEFKLLGSDKSFTLDSLTGKKVVVKFWSTGCRPCLRGLDEAYGSQASPEERAQDARVLLVSVDDDFATALKTFESRGWTGGEFVWGGYEVLKQFRLPCLPCTIVIDPEGRIDACVMGAAYEAPIAQESTDQNKP
jgi:thiol-disulfide isomerase/thioredoxin